MDDTYKDVWRIDLKKLSALAEGTVGETGDLWELVKTIGEAPENTSNHRAVAIESKIYVYGGLINNDNSKNSLYWLDVTNNCWVNHKTKVRFIA